MRPIQAAIAFHVGMGTIWALFTLVVALTGRTRAAWHKGILGAALLNMAAGIYLWHALHAGPWGATERLLVVGSVCAMIALGLQLPVALTLPRRATRLDGPPLAVYRATAVVLLVAAATMIASRSA